MCSLVALNRRAEVQTSRCCTSDASLYSIPPSFVRRDVVAQYWGEELCSPAWVGETLCSDGCRQKGFNSSFMSQERNIKRKSFVGGGVFLLSSVVNYH